MAEKIFQPQEIIFRKGDPSEFAYLIRSGHVEILKDFPENPIRLAVLNVGQILGEMGLVDERPRSLTARAIEETRVTTITRDELVDLLLRNPQEGLRYLRMLFERLRAMNTRVAQQQESTELPSREPAKKEFEIVIVPQTKELSHVLPAEGLKMEREQFRVGRSSSRNEDPLEVNDLSLSDSPPFNVSRNHFVIERKTDGVLIHDRGSYLGTIVNGNAIGGHHQGASIALIEGEKEVIAGSSHSPFRFKVIVQSKTSLE